MAKLPLDFADLLIELCEVKADFVLVGGWAVILHGHVRATDDMDLFIRPSTENSQLVFSALQAFGASLSVHGVTEQHFAVEGYAYRFGIAPLKIELLTQISGVSFEEVKLGCQVFDLDGYQIPYIGRPALIRNKKSAGRHKDLADVEELERMESAVNPESG